VIALLILLQTTLTIAVSGPQTSPEYLSLHIALAEGYFAKEGLRVGLLTTRGETSAAEALSQRRAELAATSLDAALRHASVGGQPPRLVFGLTAVHPAALLVPTAHRDSVRSIPDLIGKTVGVVTPGAPEEPLLAALLSRFKIRLDQVTQRSLGERGVVSALERGEIHAGLVSDPWASRLVQEGKTGVLADFRRGSEAARELGSPTVHAALFVLPDNPLGEERIAPLVRALLNGLHRLNTAPSEELVARLPSRVVGLPDDFRLRLAGARGVALSRGWVDAPALQASVDFLRIRSPLPVSVELPPRLDNLLSLDPLKKILEERRKR
jgi:ABC-type nitrate/sulfonate/bicarbonate transport system substrate-binding protein